VLRAACGESDAALLQVAARLIEPHSEADGRLEVDALSSGLRAAGAPYVWPRAWSFSGGESELENARMRLLRWLSNFSDARVRRCGVALSHRAGGRIRVTAVAVDVLADLEALPTRVRVGQWLEVRAALHEPASDAKLVVMGPRGAPYPVPTSLYQGQVRARFNADQAGVWLVQLLAALPSGPRPLLEAMVFAGSEPTRTLPVLEAPGEDGRLSEADPRATLYELVNAARASERLPSLERDERLEAVAGAHAEAMRHAHRTAHDAGDGDLNQRLEQFGLELTAGENVAHAAGARLAQRAIWASPSHRGNLLLPSFNLIGVGVAADPDGTLWVCQVFGIGH
jgi:uncharacterized protein YkwD